MGNWAGLEYIDDTYLHRLEDFGSDELYQLSTASIPQIIEEKARFYIGKTGAPKQRMAGGPDVDANEINEAANFDEQENPISHETKLLVETRHFSSGYKKMYLLVQSGTPEEIERLEERFLDLYYNNKAYPTNLNRTRRSVGVMKNTDRYFIYVVTD